MDMYGHPIQLSYKGDSLYKTCFGGSVSLMIIGMLVAMTYLKFHDMLLKNLTIINKNTFVKVSNEY